MEARAVARAEYNRYVDGIFGEVEEIRLDRVYRIELKIGNSYFLSNRTYSSFESAYRAARRIQGNQK